MGGRLDPTMPSLLAAPDAPSLTLEQGAACYNPGSLTNGSDPTFVKAAGLSGVHGMAGERYKIGDLLLDLPTRRVWRGRDPIPLPPLSFELLATLAQKSPAVLSSDELMQTVWGDVVVSEETVTQRVKLLRDALRQAGSDESYVRTVRSRGYALAIPAEETLMAAPYESSGQAPVLTFLGELKRRKVFRVVAAYPVVVYVALEGASNVFPALSIPDLVYRWFVIGALAGFPIAAVAGWLFDVSPKHIHIRIPIRIVWAARVSCFRSGNGSCGLGCIQSDQPAWCPFFRY